MEGMIFDERCVKLMKRILCLILALLALLSMLPACAPQETVLTETNGQDLPAQATQAATEPAAATDGAQVEHTAYDISITEVMPDNRNLLLGHEMDWVELYNPEDIPISLEGYCLTNDPENPRLMSLDGYKILAGGYLAVTLDGALQLSEQGQTVYLTCNGEVISQLTFGAAEKGEAFDDAGVCQWPTPGYANSEAGYRAYLESRELPELIISEVLASNNRYMGIRLEYYDLLEVKNNSDAPVNLKEYYLADKWENTSRYYFPDVTLQPGEFYVVYCSGLPEQGENHAPFGIGAGDTVYLAKQGTFIDALTIPADLQMNESYGRSGKVPVYLEQVTIGKENGAGSLTGVACPVADVAPGVYEDAITVTLSGEGTIYYTLDGTRPTTRSLRYKEPIRITEVKTIRTFCVSNGRKSPLTEFAYVVGETHDLPIVTISIPNRFLNDEETGIMTNIEKNLEYEGVISLFEDGERKFSEPFGFKLHGNDSRKGAKKNFQVRFRAEYGASKLEYRLFDDRDITEFDSLILKGGSEDWNRAVMRDEVCTGVVHGTTELYTQARKPVVLYINKSYWGVYYLRERFSEYYVASHMDVRPESVDILFSSGGYNQVGDGRAYHAVKNFVQNNDMRKTENYIYVTERINVTSLFDWYICRTYLGDRDTANIRRLRSDEGDNLWHWAFFDMDWSFKKHSVEGIVDLKGGDYILIQAVLESEAGQDAFLKRCAYLMRTTLNEAHIMGVIDSIYNDIKSEMPRDRERWNLSYSAWEKQVEGLRKFVRDEARTKAMLKNLKSYFSLTNAEMEHYFGDLTQLIQ